MPDGSNLSSNSQDLAQRKLAAFNTRRFVPSRPSPAWEADVAELAELQLLEGRWLEAGRAAVAERAAQAPQDADGFIAWFEALEQEGPGQGDPLFPWLATNATMEQMRWFLTQEVAGEAGFEDLCALTQVRIPQRAKLEMARNYWDEMGRGNPKGMHGPMLEVLAHRLALTPTVETTTWESLALANTMAGLACSRRYAYQSIGALGVIEQTAPGRAALVGVALKRLGLPPEDRHYFDLHSVLDVKHSAAWNAEALWPLVDGDPALAPLIAEGALMRLECGAACFRRYRAELGLA